MILSRRLIKVISDCCHESHPMLTVQPVMSLL